MNKFNKYLFKYWKPQINIKSGIKEIFDHYTKKEKINEDFVDDIIKTNGASKENDKIQNLFINSVQNIDKNIKFSLTQFDDSGVQNYIKKKKINSFFVNYKKKFLPKGKKYSNKIMLINALNQYLNNGFNYLVYSTADIIIPTNIFDEMIKINNIKKKSEYCVLVYPNILVKNGKIKSLNAPHYGIDIFIFKLNKTSVKKLIKSIKYWDQYDWE